MKKGIIDKYNLKESITGHTLCHIIYEYEHIKCTKVLLGDYDFELDEEFCDDMILMLILFRDANQKLWRKRIMISLELMMDENFNLDSIIAYEVSKKYESK